MSMMITVSLKVADFDALKVGFDGRASARAQVGMDTKAYQNIDNSNNTIAIATAPSKEVVAALSIFGGSTRDPPRPRYIEC